MTADEAWRSLAHGSREALLQLGYGIAPRCLPDEAEACGGTFAEHAVAHLATLQAVTGHHLAHLDPPPMMTAQISAEAAKYIDCEVTCHGSW